MIIANSLSIPFGRMAKISLPARKDIITFNCKLFSCHTLADYLQTKLRPDYLPQTYCGGILPWPQISLMGVATLDWPARDGNLWVITRARKRAG